MNILYDSAMPYGEAFFSTLGHAISFNAGELTAKDLVDIDVLLVRSTTRVNSELLQHANKLAFVGTATAGYNHLDVSELDKRNIAWASAAGCNAIAVAEYIVSAIYHLADEDNFIPQQKTASIVGAGNVGTALAKRLDVLNIPYVLYDPPLAKTGDKRQFGSFEEVMGADIICLHVPLVEEGAHPTRDMIGEAELKELSSSQYLINACRGEVLNNHALLQAFRSDRKLNIVLDVWDNEPFIEHALIPYLRIATAHIAGHTLEGKARGTSMLYDRLCEFYNTKKIINLQSLLPVYGDIITLDEAETGFNQLFHAVKHMYDIKKDDGNFRARMAKSEAFAEIRKNYPVRREFSAATVTWNQATVGSYELVNKPNNNNALMHDSLTQLMKELGFLIAN